MDPHDKTPTTRTSNHFLPPLPNATAVLVLGIVSIVLCGIGLITGIIALVLAKKKKVPTATLR